MSHQFNPWPLDWHDYMAYCRSIGKKSDYRDQDHFYNKRMAEMALNWNFVSLRDEAETYWLRQGAPYYNVHPFLVPKLCKVKLSSVPTHLVEVPGEYKCVNIRLAEQHPELTLQEDVDVGESKWKHNLSAVPAGSWVHSILMLRPTKRMLEIANVPIVRPPEQTVLYLFDFNVIASSGVRTWGFAPTFWLQETDTLEDSLRCQEILARTKSPAYTAMLANAMRLAVTIGFMANSNDALIEPDILSKDRFAYDQGDEAKRKTIADRARRRGKFGYNVGNDLLFLGHVPGHTKRSEGQGEGRELEYAHIRGGHPHAVRYGPKHSKVKIMWFRPVTVKPDLPFKPPEET